MSQTLVWWLMMQVVGLAALPLCLVLFRRLPDRGYTLSKAFALLLVGYWFWVLNAMHVVPNTAGGIWVVVFILFGISAIVYWLRRDELLAFARDRWWLIVAAEVVFFGAFITAAYLRSYVADLGGTEKPMDFMFLNAVTRAKHFPPPDPWLAGKTVSYYYFGYLLVSVMTRLSALETSVGFNLGLSMIVALGVIGAFGLVYNLAAPREERSAEGGPGTPAAGFGPSSVLWRPIIFGAIAAFLLVVIGNLEGLLEAIAAHNVGPMSFWKWANIDHGDLLIPYKSTHWYPDHFFVWWRATRILDNGVGIHEFPYFSFLLGDLHPHVMSIPFVLLALGVAQLFLRSDEPLDLVVWLERPFALIAFAIILGGLGFLNTWDMPTIAFLVALVALLRNRLLAANWSWGLALDTAGFLAPLYICAGLAYAPFFFGGFTSQAAGFAAEPNTGTGLFHLLLLWGPFAIILLPYAIWRLRQHDKPITMETVALALAPAAGLLLLWIVWDLLGANRDAIDISKVHSGFRVDAWFSWFPKTILPVDGRQPIMDRIGNRGWNWLTAFVMAGSVGLLLLALWREVEDGVRTIEERLPHIFALTLATTASLLILGAEFFYIKDTFDSRMNTIFKLYYQAWIMLSIAGGFALYQLACDWRLPRVRAPEAGSLQINLAGWAPGEFLVATAALAGAIISLFLFRDTFSRMIGVIIGGGIFFAAAGAGLLAWRGSETATRERASAATGPLSWRAVWAAAAVAVLAAAFVYPVIAAYNRTNGFTGNRTLDGMATTSGDQRGAIKWLSDLSGSPVIAEAVGDDYRIETGGLFSASTGLPTIVQWLGHELQWRGTTTGLDERKKDVETLYTSTSSADVRSMLQKYNVQYVIVGPAERQKYPGINVDQMSDLMVQAFQQGDVTIYRVQPGILSQTRSSP
jgi:YYY domain-containing protein